MRSTFPFYLFAHSTNLRCSTECFALIGKYMSPLHCIVQLSTECFALIAPCTIDLTITPGPPQRKEGVGELPARVVEPRSATQRGEERTRKESQMNRTGFPCHLLLLLISHSRIGLHLLSRVFSKLSDQVSYYNSCIRLSSHENETYIVISFYLSLRSNLRDYQKNLVCPGVRYPFRKCML